MNYAYIATNHRWDDTEGIITEAQWVGRNRVAEVSPIEAYRSDGLFKTEFMIGDLLLRVVDTDRSFLLVTRDIRLASVYKVIHRLDKSLQIIWWSFIYILDIWGLADYHPAERPTWRNIKPLKWLAEKWGL